jgi:hypothetical protein
MLSYAEAVAAVTAAGERFETGTVDVDGIPTTVFVRGPRNLRDVFDTARTRGDTTFLVYEDERWSFDEVMARVDALGALLVDTYGVARGDRVAIGMRNYPEWVIAFAAITSVGAVSVSLNAWWTADEMGWALEDCGAAVLIADRERVERTSGAAERLGVKVLGVRLGDGDAALPDVDRWEDVLPLGAPLPRVPIGPDDDATILYTSGTTGRPKGAVSTHRAVTQAQPDRAIKEHHNAADQRRRRDLLYRRSRNRKSRDTDLRYQRQAGRSDAGQRRTLQTPVLYRLGIPTRNCYCRAAFYAGEARFLRAIARFLYFTELVFHGSKHQEATDQVRNLCTDRCGYRIDAQRRRRCI